MVCRRNFVRGSILAVVLVLIEGVALALSLLFPNGPRCLVVAVKLGDCVSVPISVVIDLGGGCGVGVLVGEVLVGDKGVLVLDLHRFLLPSPLWSLDEPRVKNTYCDDSSEYDTESPKRKSVSGHMVFCVC